MWEWLSNNLAVTSAVVVPLLLGVVKPLLEREAGSRAVRRLRHHAQIYSQLPAGSQAADLMDELISAELKRYRARLGRKVDGGNLAAIALVSAVGGGITFGLVTWAQATSGFWSVVLWVITAAGAIFLLLLVLIGGGSRFYKSEGDDADTSAGDDSDEAAEAS